MSDFTPAAQRVSHLIRLRRLPEALERGLQLQRDFPDHAGPAWLILGAVHLADDRPELALEAARAALVELPDDYRPYRLLGHVLLKQGQTQPAIQALRTAAQLAPDEAGLHRDLARALLEADSEEAFTEAQLALRLEPGEAESYFVVGLATQDRDPREAARAYRQTLALDPDHQGAQYYLAALAALAEDDWSAAARGMARVLAKAPDSLAPVLFLDEQVWLAIRWLYLSTLLGLLLFTVFASIPLAAVLVSVATLVVGPPLLFRGLSPIRDSLPLRGSRYLRGFPGRNPVEMFVLLLLVGIWGELLFTSFHDLVAPKEAARLSGTGMVLGFQLLAVCVALAWARLPVRKWQLRRLSETGRHK